MEEASQLQSHMEAMEAMEASQPLPPLQWQLQCHMEAMEAMEAMEEASQQQLQCRMEDMEDTEDLELCFDDRRDLAARALWLECTSVLCYWMSAHGHRAYQFSDPFA